MIGNSLQQGLQIKLSKNKNCLHHRKYIKNTYDDYNMYTYIQYDVQQNYLVRSVLIVIFPGTAESVVFLFLKVISIK